MTYDAGLVARVADVLDRLGERGVRQKNVFGGWGFMRGKHAFAIVWEEGIIVKLSRDDYDRALTEPGVTPFSPMGEKPMGTWVVVDAEVVADDPELTEWVSRALHAAGR
ncbi:MAG: TfoX/Sxy family protein [Gemmatimonadota bacterium]|nr:TfoX/Sxy family protein [Gemmatimonadota bacterium]